AEVTSPPSAASDASASATPAAVISPSSSRSDAALGSPSPSAGVASPGASGMAAASPGASGAVTAPGSSPLATVTFTDISGTYAEIAIVALGQLGVLDSTSGTFQPEKPVLRREYVRWLFKTNNAVWANLPAKQIHPAESGDKSDFTDLQPSDPDFKYIEGMNAAGISVGFPDKTFKADQPVTHEQAIAIKAVLDRGGIADRYKAVDSAKSRLPEWKDKAQISAAFAGAIATDTSADDINSKSTQIGNVGRAFGAVAMFRPQAPVKRGEAAMLLQVIGGHAQDTNGDNAPRSVASVLHPSPSPSP
ncbi:MAG: S-layer protein, partial [Candidatus Eremiobacteraeota bacterium]|nr:S-layer protein [Candidatus Eremiobacteraeota bacterium]